MEAPAGSKSALIVLHDFGIALIIYFPLLITPPSTGSMFPCFPSITCYVVVLYIEPLILLGYGVKLVEIKLADTILSCRVG